MGTDVTQQLQVVGRNDDGTFNVRLIPAAPETALVPAASAGFQVNINGQIVSFSSAQDYQRAVAALGGNAGMPTINTRGGNGGGGGGGASSFVRSATDAAEAVNSFMEARNLTTTRKEFAELKAAIATSRASLASQTSTYPALVGPLLDLFDATSDAYTLSISLLDEQIQASYVQSAIGAGRTISDFTRKSRGGSGSGGGGNSESSALVGGVVGLGAGLLLADTLGRGGRGHSGSGSP